jgi:hypothetical protein
MKFRPLHDRVVIRRLEGEDKTKGGIIIPDTVKEVDCLFEEDINCRRSSRGRMNRPGFAGGCLV